MDYLTTAKLRKRLIEIDPALKRSQHELARLCAIPGRVPGAKKEEGRWKIPDAPGLERIVVARGRKA